MEIIIGKFAGFCNGAKNAVDKTNEALNGNNLYSVGEIIHNEEVVKYLKGRGLIVKENINEIPDNSKVIVRAHGETIDFYEAAKIKNLNIVDLTCNKVKLIHDKILENEDKFIIIIGKKTHPEVIAHQTYSNTCFVIDSFDDITDAYKAYLASNKNLVYVVSQTTFNSELFDELISKIKEVFNIDILIDKTICNATAIRQKEAKEIASKVNKMIIIGGKNSSNTKELAVEASKYCKDVYLIVTKDELNKDMFNKDDVIGITAGASTPDTSIKEVVSYLEELYNEKNIV